MNSQEYPWNHPDLHDWSICGMNHYRVEGKRHLFVSMTKGKICITAEGSDEAEVFASLIRQACIQNRIKPFRAMLFEIGKPRPGHGKFFSREAAQQIVSKLNEGRTMGPYDPQKRNVDVASAAFFVKRAWITEDDKVMVDCETISTEAAVGISSLVNDGKANFEIHVAGASTSVVDPELRPDNFYFGGLAVSMGAKHDPSMGPSRYPLAGSHGKGEGDAES